MGYWVGVQSTPPAVLPYPTWKTLILRSCDFLGILSRITSCYQFARLRAPTSFTRRAVEAYIDGSGAAGCPFSFRSITSNSLDSFVIISTTFTMGAETILSHTEHIPAWGDLTLTLKGELAPATITPKLPDEISGPLAWNPSTFESDADYTITLDDREIKEVRSALSHFNELDLSGSEVSTTTFPLPTLGPKLRQAAEDVHNGKGFVVVRGIRDMQPGEFSPEDKIIIFLGISSYIAGARGRQDENGNMLSHIRNAKLSKTPQSQRPTRYSSRASTFHTDTFCDILALQSRSNAMEGGATLVSSTWTVYNKLQKEHPDLCELLARPIWPFDSRGSFFPCSTRPLLYHHDGKVMMNFAREPLLGLEDVKRKAGLPVLSQGQKNALEIVERLATEGQISINTEPGDLLFINNHGVLHSREEFTDAVENPRYLVRMWLKNEELAWDLPEDLQYGNSRIYDRDNGLGERWNLADTPRIEFAVAERLTS
ncbi:uncharacterized protein PODANS_3_10500 [Podospora anserina S mat+]|uniref:Podospora anserina S mat+ genomic DNA chromosome 3, supercontig 3 n=1 Tax=Podospora anserina (strain S / ATCC MYA-4624 / DSM 980 / FGSC 10383) TaxID=515849 RepID=B2AD39_PODAN|nr:uncharacterized protein PODANS_3_10500 [Podospora anserina S mat+]CAP61354.1 unnamed protein product [Podospora anserina S mat+]CDP27709.1 Putative protein of unknown function [Podospora anserina S mat+]